MTNRPTRERGAATLAVAALLAGAMLLAALFVNRHLLAEQRSGTQQLRSTQAFEAAEAGLDWALAQLNAPRRIGTDCSPATGATSSFRERHLRWEPRTGAFVAGAQRPACVRNGNGWTCHCPAEGTGTPAFDDDGAAHPGFAVSLLAGPRPGTVRLRSQGCSHFARPCATGALARSDATAQVEVTLALLPGLARAPAAALTAGGSVVASGALGVHNADPRSGGIALHAGGSVQADALRLTAPAGSSQAQAFLAADPALAAASMRERFASTFGTDLDTWRAQPMVKRVACSGECGAELHAAVGDGVAQQLVAVDGALRIDGPLTLGTPQRPVVLVVDGPAQFNGAVTLHGLLVARRLQWDGTTTAGALIRGAALIDSDVVTSAAPDMARDAAILDALRGSTGTFVRLPGSWRDF